MWSRFTNLGDLAVMLPLAMGIAIWLLAQKKFASSLRWLLAFGSAGLLVAISKIAFIGWGIGSRDFDFTGISGHTMLATATLPVLLYLLAQSFQPRYKQLALIMGWLAGAAIGYSRLEVHAHSLSEVITGLLCGLLASAAFIRQAKDSYSRTAGLALIGLLVLITSLQFGQKAPGQDIITQLALTAAQRGKPYSRADLHAAILVNGKSAVPNAN